MRNATAGLLAAFLCVLPVGGCKHPAPEVRYVTQEVRVPVPVPCPQPKLPPRPVLPIETMPAEVTPDEQEKAWAGSVQALEGYAEQLEEVCVGR